MEKTSGGSGVTYSNPKGQNVFNRLSDFIRSGNKKVLGVGILLFLIIAVILTVLLSQQRQDIRQRAAQSNNLLTSSTATVNHQPWLREVNTRKSIIPDFSSTAISSFTVNGTTYNYSTGTMAPTPNYHNTISITANGTVTIRHDLSNYQYWQSLTPDFLRNQNSDVQLTLEGEPVIERRFLPPPYPSFASLQIELLDPNTSNDHRVLAHISNMDIWNIGRGVEPQTFTVPRGKSIVVYIRAINAQVFFQRLKLLRVADQNLNIWEAQREEENPWQSGIFHNAANDVDTGGALDSNGVPTGRPSLNSGRVRIIDDPNKTQAYACLDVNPYTTYKVTGNLTSSPILGSPYPTFAGISIDELQDNCTTYANKSYTFNIASGASEEFKPTSRKIGIFLRAWNSQVSFSYPNVKLEEVAKDYYLMNGTVSTPQPVITTPGYPVVAKIVGDVYNLGGRTDACTVPVAGIVSSDWVSKTPLPMKFTLRQGQGLCLIDRLINAKATFSVGLTLGLGVTAVDVSNLSGQFSEDYNLMQNNQIIPVNTTATYSISGAIQGGTSPSIPGEQVTTQIRADVERKNSNTQWEYQRSAVYPSQSTITANAGERINFLARAVNTNATFSNLGLTYDIPSTATPVPTNAPSTADCNLISPPTTITVGNSVTFNATFSSTPATTNGEIDVFTSNGTGSTPISWGSSYGSFSGNAQFINSGSKTNGTLTWIPNTPGTYQVACRANNRLA